MATDLIWLDKALPLGQYLCVAPPGSAFGASSKDSVDVLKQQLYLGVGLYIVGSIHLSGLSTHLLQSVKDAFVMDGFGENLGYDVVIVQSHVSDHDTGLIALARRAISRPPTSPLLSRNLQQAQKHDQYYAYPFP